MVFDDFSCPVSIFLFSTLNFNHRTLYAPSDFQNEENFFKSLQPASPADSARKIQEEIAEIEREPSDITQSLPNLKKNQVAAAEENSTTINEKLQTRKNLSGRLAMIEDIVLNKLSTELGGQITKRSVSWVKSDGGSLVFDGFGVINNRFIAVEIKYVKDGRYSIIRAQETAFKVEQEINQIKELARSLTTLIIVIVYGGGDETPEQLLTRLNPRFRRPPFQFRIYSAKELEEEFVASAAA